VKSLSMMMKNIKDQVKLPTIFRHKNITSKSRPVNLAVLKLQTVLWYIVSGRGQQWPVKHWSNQWPASPNPWMWLTQQNLRQDPGGSHQERGRGENCSEKRSKVPTEVYSQGGLHLWGSRAESCQQSVQIQGQGCHTSARNDWWSDLSSQLWAE